MKNTTRLRKLIEGDGLTLMPFTYDPFTARIAEAAGFDAVYVSGFGSAMSMGSNFIASLVTGLLGGIGFDGLPERTGLAQAIPSDTSPSQIVGRIVVFFVMLFATAEAAERLGFSQVSELVAVLIGFGANVLLGLVIISVGYWLSNLAHGAIGRVSGEGSAAVAAVVRFGILGIVIAMGLRAMGLANEIVNLAFGLTLGAVAVAVALSFGLGGRDATWAAYWARPCWRGV